MTDKKIETLDASKMLKFVLGSVPEFVEHDPKWTGGQKIERGARHDGTSIHSDMLKSELIGEIGRAVFLTPYEGARLRISDIAVETEFLGTMFSHENENTGMTESWSIHMEIERPAMKMTEEDKASCMVSGKYKIGDDKI